MQGKTIRQIRQFHNYIGIFFAPAILFFAVSGAFQTLGMHENRGHGEPMTWVAWMSSVHKDQVLPHARPDAGAPPRVKGPHGGSRSGSPLHPDAPFSALKLFVLLMALGLTCSSTLGIVIAFTNPKTRRLNSAILAAGTLLPVVLLFLLAA